MQKTLAPIPRLPAWIRLPLFILRPSETMDNYQRLHGDIYNFGREERAFIYLSNPQGIQQVFAAEASIFDTAQKSRFFDVLFGFNSIFALDGDPHRQKRKLWMPTFHSDRIVTYSQFIRDITARAIAAWQPGTTIRLRPYMQSITLQVILKIVLGENDSARSQAIQQLSSRLLDTTSSPLSSTVAFFPILQKDWGRWSPWGRFLHLQAEMDRLILAEIRDRQENPNPEAEDLISLLLASRDETGNPPTARQIRDDLTALLVAGHETTASALCWALYWIHYHPEVEAKLRAELTQYPDRDRINKLPYLNAVCAETLRIYPIAPVAFIRRLKTTWTLLDYDLEPGTVLLPCIYQLHHREDLYPEPKQFRPERFLERQFAPHEYIPFGGGNRRCVGSALALHEMKLAIATILDNFTFALVRPRPEKPVRRGVTLAPRGNLSLRILERQPTA